MPSESAKRRAQAKKQKSQGQGKAANGVPGSRKQSLDYGDAGDLLTNGNCNGSGSISRNDSVASQLSQLDIDKAAARSATGVLGSHPDSRDLHIDELSITFHGVELLSSTGLELNTGQRYGLIGLNGCGKSTLLSVLAMREIPIPDHIDIFHLSSEMPPSEMTPLEAVMEVDVERNRLEDEAAAIIGRDDNDNLTNRLTDIYERLEELEAESAESNAARLLHGLGFTTLMMQKKMKHFSGGWRMRIALARALYIKPSLLLMDEPTNHLDLEACVWLEDELKRYKRILVIISHSQDFLNGVCTNIVHFHRGSLIPYTGNYDQFVQTRRELEDNQMKQYRWEQDQISHMKDYIARFGHGSAKLARQAQSKEKTLAKMVAGGLAEKVINDKTVNFSFAECGKVPPPVIMVQNVSFRYSADTPVIYDNIDFGLDCDARWALVGPNGAGKSTLLKLIAGELFPTDGIIRKNTHLRIGRYHQHLNDQMDVDLSPVDFMLKEFPEVKERDAMRKIVGRYGLTGKQQVCPIANLSDGQRCRVTFAWLAWRQPHMLLLDEPTNHLDIETIDALADAIKAYDGGLVLVSHDFRLISQVANEIWICNHQKITRWEGDILSYKKHLKKKILLEESSAVKKVALVSDRKPTKGSTSVSKGNAAKGKK